MSDYELKFQEDLEKAQALSLESLALDQFRRGIKSVSPTHECDGPTRPSLPLPPPLPPPPRRPARRSRDVQEVPHRSHSSSPTGCEVENQTNDLICFTSPSSKGKQHQELKEYIDSLHRLNKQPDQLALVYVPKENIPKHLTTNSNIIGYPNRLATSPYQTSLVNNNSPNLLFNLPNTQISNRPTNGSNYESQNKLYPNLSGLSENYKIPNYNANIGYNPPPLYSASNNFVQTVPQNLKPNAFVQGASTPNSSSYPQLNIFASNNQSNSSTNNDSVKTSPSVQSLSSTSWSSGNESSLFGPQNDGNVKDKDPRRSDSNISLRPMKTSSSDLNRYTRAHSETPVNYKSVSNKSSNFLSPNGSSNLIDLGANTSTPNIGSVRVSVLEAFDPLMAEQSTSEYACSSECSSSVYDEYDPLDFLYGGSDAKKETPVYAVVAKRNGELPSPLPSPPPKVYPPPIAQQYKKKTNTVSSKLYECISFIKKRKYEPELVAFLDMVKDIRCAYIYSDTDTNPGYVVASKSLGRYPEGTSIKLLVYHDKDTNPVTFTCDVESTVEHVILHVVCEVEGEIREDISVFTLRVWGMCEYLTPGSALSEYDYVRRCVRLERDIMLCLQSTRDTSLARLERDDTRDSLLTLEELIPNQNSMSSISFQNLSILLETLERELSRLSSSVMECGNARSGSTAQAVKAICTLLGSVETMQVTNSLAALISACSQSQPDGSIMKPEIVQETGDYCSVTLRHTTIRDTVGLHCQRLREAVKAFVAIYCRSHVVDFQVDETQYTLPSESDKSMNLSSVTESVLFYMEGVHRQPINWNHDEFVVQAQIFHGTKPLKGSRSTMAFPTDTTGFYPRIIFESWMNLDEISIASIPKEARLVLTLYGRTLATTDSQNASASSEKEKAAAEASQRDSSEKRDDDDEYEEARSQIHVEQEELGWAAIQLFDFNGMLVSGNFILSIWPMCADRRLGPAPDIKDHPPTPHPCIHIEIPSYCSGGVYWKEDTETEVYPSHHSLEALDKHTQQQLIHLVDQGPYQKMPPEFREILWEKRHYLVGLPGALPLVLLASMHWDATSKRHLMHLLDQWTPLTPHDALHLLLPCFPDEGVRERAVSWLWSCDIDLLTTLLPQLCLALRYEPHLPSPLCRLLLARALHSPRFAHRLYWQLMHDIPGNSPQNSSEEFLGISLDGEPTLGGIEPDPSVLATSRWVRRNQLLLRALLAIVGENLAERLLKQQLLVKSLTEVASSIKNCKENVRNRTLMSGMENLLPLIKSNNICLPLCISQEIHDIDVKSCSYFPSNTLPMKINFISNDNAIVPAIFKIGDDLRQDTLVLQVIRVMDQLWLMEGLDLRMVTFEAIPTQFRKGIIEMVCSAETLRVIQVEWGLTGSFKDKPIAEWLAKHNPSELEYERAVDNFTASCAGYSVATYLLGICDRHNDNIMLKTSGHLFHIDFGKFLGDAQMFGNFKRDRTPFVLTPDMAYVINGGERPTQKFHRFVELCCTAFNIVRKHQNLILNLFSLMASSGIGGVSASAVGYVRAALLPGQSPPEAAAAFARLIHSAIKSKFTPINFFLHNLAQLRAGDQTSSSSGLLSFMPKTYTMQQEGRLTNVEVLGYEKRYDPEKYYVYTLRIYREGQTTPFVLYRSYKHFTELYQKICLHFPLAKVHSLPVGLGMGRTNTKQAAERRFHDVQEFLRSMFSLADEISHHDLVYTFFHPMLRDQQDVGPQRVKHKNDIQHNIGDNEVGSLKITLQYSAGVLSVLILHAQSLPMIQQGVPPSPYVKVYLIPDPSKETKRKTRVLKKNCHPSFMDMLEYRLPLEVIRGRSLQATVWHHDPLQENQFLGGVQIPLHTMDLTKEITQWYTLQYIPR